MPQDSSVPQGQPNGSDGTPSMSVADLLAQAGLGAEGADEDPRDLLDADALPQLDETLRRLTGGADGSGQKQQTDGQAPAGDGMEPGGEDALHSFREAYRPASDAQQQTDDEFEAELAQGFGRSTSVPREKAERLQKQRDKLMGLLGIQKAGDESPYAEALALIRQAGPDSRTAIGNLTAVLYQQFQQQTQNQGGYDMGGQQQGGMYPPQAPAFQPPAPQQYGQATEPAWVSKLTGAVESLTSFQQQQLAQQQEGELLSSVERELRKWDLLADPLAQQYVGMAMRTDPSTPIPDIVKRYAEAKRSQYMRDTGQAGSGGVPAAGSLSPDIGRGTSAAAPPAQGGLDLRQLQGEARAQVATRLIEGMNRGRR